MPNFDLQIPTRIIFGANTIERLEDVMPDDCVVLLLYGGGSIKNNGTYQSVVSAINGRKIVEFGGIEANPRYETILKAVDLCHQNKVDFILAVGGGSVVDAAKFLAAAVNCEGEPWSELKAGRYPENCLPVGAILTLPATGSESNPVSVITSVVRRLKVPFSSEKVRPVFAILDPNTMVSLDHRQLSNGTVDAFTHVVEQYATVEGNTPVQYGYSESLMTALVETGPKLLDSAPSEARENLMWAANQALNGLIGAGVNQDWSTHMIGHAITELYGVDHARTLTVVMPSLLRFKSASKQAMLARMARRVWRGDISDDSAAAQFAIDRIEWFFGTMGMPVRLSELAPIEVSPDAVVSHLERAGQTALGEHADIGPREVREILRMAA